MKYSININKKWRHIVRLTPTLTTSDNKVIEQYILAQIPAQTNDLDFICFRLAQIIGAKYIKGENEITFDFVQVI
jgi:hypothetical protein